MEKSTKPTTRPSQTLSYRVKGWFVMGGLAALVIAMMAGAIYLVDWQLQPGWAFEVILFLLACLVCFYIAGPDKF